jgi:uncharacterized protein (DUF305 family)
MKEISMLAKPLTLLAPVLLVLTLALPAAAETMDHSADHSGHAMTGMESAATMAFMEANMKMHAAMEIEFTGNADVDFIRGMIAHHQGAIDMAKVVLDHGTDPEVRKLAETIIAAQEGEITWMQDWLAKNGG